MEKWKKLVKIGDDSISLLGRETLHPQTETIDLFGIKKDYIGEAWLKVYAHKIDWNQFFHFLRNAYLSSLTFYVDKFLHFSFAFTHPFDYF